MNKKKLLSLALVFILIAIVSFSTLAWFNDSKTVTNEFYVVTSDDTSADDIFSVTVYEEDADGKQDFDGLEFKNVVPGQTLEKNPVVENTGRYAQWIRLTITFESFKAWQTLVDGTVSGPIDLLTKAADFDTNWKGASFSAENNAYEYVYYLSKPLEAGQSVDVFTAVNIPTTLEQSDFFAIQGEAVKLSVKAEAIQLELGDSAKKAFAAFETPAP